MERFFRISARGSTVRTEVLAGLATFATMAYILVVNPSILGAVADGSGLKLDHAQLVTATALVAGLLTIAMGVFANVPMALAAGLGINAFVTYTLVAGRGLDWSDAMGVIVIEGAIMLVLVLAGLREAIMNAIPDVLKRSIGAGIGLFIALIGLVTAGIVEHPKDGGTVIAMNPDIATWNTLVFVVGLVAIGVLVAREVPAALLLGILLATVLGVVINGISDGTPVPGAELPGSVTATPDFGLVGDVSFNVFDALGTGAAIAVVVAVLMANFFDAMGTALAVGRKAGLVDEDGRLPMLRRILLVESAGAIAGGAASASSNTIFVESTAGAAQGARTGLANVVTGVLFLCCMFLSPLAAVIPSAATGPVLVAVGAMMIGQISGIDWDDIGVALPAFATVVLMPFTYSIANGVGAGVILYVLIALLRGRWRDVHPLLGAVAAVFVWYFSYGTV
ncbi:NCS2 family permease [Patulibacter minatonensis]|uniref:NCS2 family permease n=1 Tax=Patulibacter minatonensis TaxID=298163 RepID=UPI000479FC44|nr:NCS2 family permease [Patulibacter minatonensis]